MLKHIYCTIPIHHILTHFWPIYHEIREEFVIASKDKSLNIKPQVYNSLFSLLFFAVWSLWPNRLTWLRQLRAVWSGGDGLAPCCSLEVGGHRATVAAELKAVVKVHKHQIIPQMLPSPCSFTDSHSLPSFGLSCNIFLGVFWDVVSQLPFFLQPS